MIDLYTSPTPTGHKVSIALEEMGLEYEVHTIDLRSGEQKQEPFLAHSPNGRIPAIYDQDYDLSIFESGAIMIHLAEKSGRLVPADPRRRVASFEWLMWQMGGLGPMMGQAEHFFHHADKKDEYATERYVRETSRLLNVLERQLADRDYICQDYSIADMACFPWVRINKLCGQRISDFPNVAQWYGRIRERPAVARGLDILKDHYVEIAESPKAKRQLFGSVAQS